MGQEDRQPDQGRLGPEGLQRAAGAVPAAALAEVRRDRRHPHRRRLARPARAAPGRHGQGSAEGRHRAALPGDHRGEHGQRTPRRAARLHRRGPSLLPQGPAGEVRKKGAHHLAGVDGDGEDRPGRRTQGGQRQDLRHRLPGPRVRGPDLQRAGVGGQLRRRHHRRRAGQGHHQQPQGDRGDQAGRLLDQEHRPRGRPQLRRGGSPRRVPVRQRGVHAQLAVRVGALAGARQPCEGQGRRDGAAEGRSGGQEHRNARRLAVGGEQVLEECQGRGRSCDVPDEPGGGEAGGHRGELQPDHPGALQGQGHPGEEPVHRRVAQHLHQRGGASFAGWPLLRTIYFSFTDANLDNMGSYAGVGFANFASLAQDPEWWHAVKNTVEFAAISVTLETILGLVIALTLNAHLAGRGIVRAAVLIPWAIPTVVSAQMWNWMYNDLYGVLNYMLLKVGFIDHPYAWTGSPSLALAAVIIVDVWKTTPFMALLILAALHLLPGAIYEAAKLDRIPAPKGLSKLTLPLIRPALLVAVIFRTLDALRIFDLPYVLTGNSRETASMAVYGRQKLIAFQDWSYA